MLRDFKFLRRNSGKNPNKEEIENVPVNPRDSLGPQIIRDSPRPPLYAIQEPIQISKGSIDQKLNGVKVNKTDRTPMKPKAKKSDSMPLSTPEKQGLVSKNHFGWAQKSDYYSSSSVVESREEGRVAENMNTPRSTRMVGRANSSYTECNSTQSTPNKSVIKPPNPGFCLASGSRPPASGAARITNFAALSKGIPSSSYSASVVNTVEVPHFELREDPSFWMEHNIQVLIRVRPLNNMEKSTYGYSRCLKQETAQCITWIGQPETPFMFDHVACETIEQETLFRMAGLPMVENCLSGYNSCMFAYGQTGSGKTYTMLGGIEELEVNPSPNRGMTPRIFEFLFARIRAEEEIRRDERLIYNCKCSFLEIYNEQISDLLDPSSTNLMLREDIKKGVYVENLSEFEVQTVGDILQLLSQGSANRKVAATNMNRESSRSHSVFTCVIESRWEKDSTTNFRFARLNLVDLAGSERQKTSGAEGERLKEAANINKSLSTLGHVIMVLVDVAHGRPRHIPYRDSRLTFLLQDSLGGNSKTMIIANVSPSICCASETLNTLKFAQRAKLIQNNAVINEDSSRDVVSLQHQIRLLKEELSALKHEKVSRSLSFGPTIERDARNKDEDGHSERMSETDHRGNLLIKAPEGVLRMSCKQLKSLEATLAGAIRREQMAGTSIKRLEAEIELLNRLVSQREEDTRCTKMMLKFREDKIQRMESLLGGFTSADAYLLEENREFSEEIQLLRARVDRNPEVTRFAVENIRLQEQVRRFQDFYEEGERDMLLAEVSELRNQLTLFLDGNSRQQSHQNTSIASHAAVHTNEENNSLHVELKRTMCELEETRSKLENNAMLKGEIHELNTSLNAIEYATQEHDSSPEFLKKSVKKVPIFNDQIILSKEQEKDQTRHTTLMMREEDVVDLQLELDILKIILKEEKSYHSEAEEMAQSLNRELQSSKEMILSITKKFEYVQEELEKAKSVIEALESQQFLMINEIEELRNSNSNYAELLQKQMLETSSLKEQIHAQEFRDLSSYKHSKNNDSPIEAKLKKMHDSLEKAKRLNQWYQSDNSIQASKEEEMDEVRKQVEAETAEVIICLQEELAVLQQEVQDSGLKEMDTSERLVLLQAEMKNLEENLCTRTQRNMKLTQMLEDKESQLRNMSEEWERLTIEIEGILTGGHEALKEVSDQLDDISSSFPRNKNLISEQLGRLKTYFLEKEVVIEELNQCLKDAMDKRNYMECMLRSLKGAALVMTETHQHECSEMDKENLLLTSELNTKTSVIEELESIIKHGEDQLRNASCCATAAFVIVNRLFELNSKHVIALNNKDVQLRQAKEMIIQKDTILYNQLSRTDEAEKQNEILRMELNSLEECCDRLKLQLSEEQVHAKTLRMKLEETEENNILEAREKLVDLKSGVSTLKLCMTGYLEKIGGPGEDNSLECSSCLSAGDKRQMWTGKGTEQDISHVESCVLEDVRTEASKEKFSANHMDECIIDGNCSACEQTLMGVNGRHTITAPLKKETESALQSVQGLQAEMAKLHDEKEDVRIAEQRYQKSIKSLMNQVAVLQNSNNNFEVGFELKITALDGKLKGVEEIIEESCTSWFQLKQLLEAELDDATAVAAQKSIEVSCVLEKFEEMQDTMKEADIIINELMMANEALKLNIHELKEKENALIDERGILTTEVQNLQSSNNLKVLHYEKLEKQYESDIVDMKSLVLELGEIVSEVQTTSTEDCKAIASDFLDMKSQLCESTRLIRSSLEDVWSEIVVKDFAMSVLHLCHMGILLETVTGLNAENGLLHCGLCESNSAISELQEHNFRSQRELEMCRILKGKLLADLKKGFDGISSKVDESGELTLKLASFEKKIQDLQLQEDLMLQRSNHMGSELSVLIKDLDFSNSNVLASILDQERLIKDKDELLEYLEGNFLIELCEKDFEFLMMSSELKQLALLKADAKSAEISSYEVLENFKKDIIFQSIDAASNELMLKEKEIEHALLQKEVEEITRKQQELLSELDESFSTIFRVETVNNALKQDIQSLKEIAHSNSSLKGAFEELAEEKTTLLSQVQNLESQQAKLLKDVEVKEAALETSSSHISKLDQQKGTLLNDICLLETELCRLQNEADMKDEELRKMSCLEKKNEALQYELAKAKTECCILFQDLEDKRAEFESSIKGTNDLDVENHGLKENKLLLENHIAKLNEDLNFTRKKLENLQHSQSVVEDELSSKIQGLIEENAFLRNKLEAGKNNEYECLNALNVMKNVNLMKTVDTIGDKILNLNIEKILVLEDMFQKIVKEVEMASKFFEELEYLENLVTELKSQTSSLEIELSRKDDILKGLLFDLSLLQESASNSKDQKDEIEELLASLSALEKDFDKKSGELDQAVAEGQKLETQLKEKAATISALEMDIVKEQETMNSLSHKNDELMTNVKDASDAKMSMEKELIERNNINENLRMEVVDMGVALVEMTKASEFLKSNLDTVVSQRDDLEDKVLTLTDGLEMARAVADENRAIAVEAQEIAKTRKIHAEEKDEEVKLLERSIEELECTVNVLEQKVGIVKEEAERQRLEREELELELHAVKQQMQNVKSNDSDSKRQLDENEKNRQEALQRIQTLEKEIAARDGEIAQCKAYISELNLHAEAQACEYKQKFKSLEAMLEQFKSELPATQETSSSNKLDKNSSKSRGGGSPFKCIGLGLAQQIKSNRDEELSAGRQRVEELEAIAASRQKEIFSLKARLAATESMTHDVIRDLLGVKLNMNSYATLMDNQQLHTLIEESQHHDVEAQVKELEVVKQQINEFINERNGWLEEIERKQAEMVAAQVTLEQLSQKDQLLTTENEMLKADNINHKKKLMELEAEVKKLSGHQNLQQYIHHHTKIKEENNLLKHQNEDLSIKLRRTEAILSRVKEELARFHASNGLNPFINFDEEQQLDDKLKETEEERLQLAQKLIGLCTSILKAAGIRRSTSDISLSVAEEALEQLKNRVISLEMELQDVKLKNRMSDERSRLSDHRQQTSVVSSRNRVS
ncbi:kinesin-like protein KIN-12F isoform X3 [Olea europaea var. sylvestris]|uniref:kinesin-like protein KIN-12F isoform X3 n=1 Tax=Olea europaea var. sylvestris TaxID=158386 RepID=UPI000C1D590A|nr:kinesin-like protein KIN-12F isoform X3 [Olea europaea var. sylvestris]